MERELLMDQLTKFCRHCGRTGLEPVSSTQLPCRSCGGTGYELTNEGNELRKFVVALLGDYEVKNELLKLVQAIDRNIKDSAV